MNNFQFTSTLLVRKSAGVDDYGDPLPGNIEFSLMNCVIDESGGNTERVGRVSASENQCTVYCADPDADVNELDEIIIEGKVWQVDGQPISPKSPFSGWRPGRIIHLRRTVG